MLNVYTKIKEKIQRGLWLFFLGSQLKTIGIEINAYYWMQEGIAGDLPLAQENIPADCSFMFLGPEEMKIIGNIPGRKDENEEGLLLRLKKGNRCFAAKYQDRIAAFTWFDFTGERFIEQDLRLNDTEVYLYDMYTMKSFRGKEIAPRLRYESYKILKEMGRAKCYSASNILNTPSINFKRKLKAKIIAMHLDIRLFRKFHWNWRLKDYTNP